MFASSFPRVFDTLSQYDLTSPLLMFLFCRCHDLVADWWIVVVAARLLMLGFGMGRRSGTDDEYDDKSEDIVITTTSDSNRRDDWCCRGFFARRRTIADLRDEKTATYYTVDATWREGPSVAVGGQ